MPLYLFEFVDEIESRVFEELHVDRTTRELGDGAALNTDERQGIEDKNGKMLNGNATSMHRQLDAQSRGGERNRARGSGEEEAG